MPGLLPVTLDDAIAELARERRMRGKVYGRAISDGKLSKANADLQMERLDYAIFRLERLRDAEKKAATNG